jgi:cardiolipin synthase A/B
MTLDATNIVLYYALVFLGQLLIVLVFTHMIYKKRTPAGIAAWLLFMVLVPYVAVLLYMVFGLRKRENRYKKKPMTLRKRVKRFREKNPIHDVLRSYGVADATENIRFELLDDSKRAYERFLSCARNAKKSIYVSVYIFKYDDVGEAILKELTQKAKEGVEIKLLLDSLGSIELYFTQRRFKALKKAGARVEFFMPIFKMPFRNYVNLRNHRKIYIFDDETVIGGGMNVSNEYFGANASEKRFEDLMFLVEGGATELYFEIFASDWFYASEEKISFAPSSPAKRGDAYLQVVPSGPDMDKDVLYEALLCGIYGATKRVWIVTPYFIPDDSITQALCIAKRKGLDVKLITPKETKHATVNIARGSYMRELEEEGVEVALYDGLTLHAKAILFDDTSAMLGSVNVDNRSLFLNYEVATFVYSSKTILEVESWMGGLLRNSSKGMPPISKPRAILENLMRIAAPQL